MVMNSYTKDIYKDNFYALSKPELTQARKTSLQSPSPFFSDKQRITKEKSKGKLICSLVLISAFRLQLYRGKGLQRPQQSQFIQTDLHRPQYSNAHLDSNSIGDKGCEWLAKGQWPQLSFVCLSNFACIQRTTE